MQTVAAISFLDNHSLSMDMENVHHIEISGPKQIDDGTWFCELLIRGENGTVAINLLADEASKLLIATQGLD